MPVTSLAPRLGGALIALTLVLAGCATTPPAQVGPQVSPATRAMYAAVDDGQFVVPAIPDRYLTPQNVRQEVDFWGDEPPRSIVVDPYSYYLYYVLGGNRAIRYRIGVGAMGRTFSGRAAVGMKREWPTWTPTANMISIEPDLYGPWAGGMAAGPGEPAGVAGDVSLSERAGLDVPHPRHLRAVLDRRLGVGRLHPDVPAGRDGSLPTGAAGHAGSGALRGESGYGTVPPALGVTGQPISASQSTSLRMATPSSRAAFSFDPAPGPATT